MSYLALEHIVLPLPTVQLFSIHARLGHINPNYILKAHRLGTITGLSEEDVTSLRDHARNGDCHCCIVGKATRAVAKEGSRIEHLDPLPFAVIYSDICQVTDHQVPARPSYFITFKCGYTNFTKVYPMRKKSEAIRFINKYVNWVKNQFSERRYTVKTLFSDQGKEYLSQAVIQALENFVLLNYYQIVIRFNRKLTMPSI